MSRNDWKEKRILAINRKLDGSQDMAEKYVEEYNNIIDSKARNKKEYNMGKDIACLASVYNLTCQEVEDIIEEAYKQVMERKRLRW